MRNLGLLLAGTILVLGACGGSEDSAALDVTNGATSASISSHWASNPCIATSLRVAFAADGTGTYKDPWCNSSFTWSTPNPTTILISYTGSCPIGLASIQELSGGAGAGGMTGRGYRGDGYSPSYCDFTLVGGPIP